LVRGFTESIFLSANLLKAMAAVLAPENAIATRRSVLALGKPLAARTAPVSANGRAKRVCSIFTKESNGLII
jgi:hypothetical protein